MGPIYWKACKFSIFKKLMESGWFPEWTFPEYISVLNHPARTHPVQTCSARTHPLPIDEWNINCAALNDLLISLYWFIWCYIHYNLLSLSSKSVIIDVLIINCIFISSWNEPHPHLTSPVCAHWPRRPLLHCLHCVRPWLLFMLMPTIPNKFCLFLHSTFEMNFKQDCNTCRPL